MTPVNVYNPNAEAIDPAKLDILLSEADCTPVPLGQEARSLIVVVSSELHQDAALEPTVQEALNRGMCIVALWPSPPNTDELPEVLRKFAQKTPWKPSVLALAAKCEATEETGASSGFKMRHHDC